ncbi:hypothetical protein K1719_013268 [Acacia pycnantha]|nr:hypothetical protein K1719_013268 [Acacia pycnantha]
MFLLQVLGKTSKQNPRAGPDHWKYWIRKFKTLEDDPGSECGPNLTTERSRNRSSLDIDIEFMGFWDKEVPDIFSPPQNPKSTLLASNRKPPNNKLLEDCHYHPQDIVRLFLHPNVMFPGKRGIKPSDENFWQLNNSLMPHDGEVNDGLISQPCKVKEIEIKYEKTTKQVNVHALKNSLWHHLKDSRETTELVHNGAISFEAYISLVSNQFFCCCRSRGYLSSHVLHLPSSFGQ